jgi:hypothetical protein
MLEKTSTLQKAIEAVEALDPKAQGYSCRYYPTPQTTATE